MTGVGGSDLTITLHIPGPAEIRAERAIRSYRTKLNAAQLSVDYYKALISIAEENKRQARAVDELEKKIGDLKRGMRDFSEGTPSPPYL